MCGNDGVEVKVEVWCVVLYISKQLLSLLFDSVRLSREKLEEPKRAAHAGEGGRLTRMNGSKGVAVVRSEWWTESTD
jgi:hypothetical protein